MGASPLLRTGLGYLLVSARSELCAPLRPCHATPAACHRVCPVSSSPPAASPRRTWWLSGIGATLASPSVVLHPPLPPRLSTLQPGQVPFGAGRGGNSLPLPSPAFLGSETQELAGHSCFLWPPLLRCLNKALLPLPGTRGLKPERRLVLRGKAKCPPPPAYFGFVGWVGDRGGHSPRGGQLQVGTPGCACPVASSPAWALHPHHLAAIVLLWKLSPTEDQFNPNLAPVWSQLSCTTPPHQHRLMDPDQLLPFVPRSRMTHPRGRVRSRPSAPFPKSDTPLLAEQSPLPALPTTPSETGPCRSAVPDSEGYFNGCITLNEPSAICSTP